jgi:hypothetical protein
VATVQCHDHHISIAKFVSVAKHMFHPLNTVIVVVVVVVVV